jgi:hypothetical protein
MPMKIIISQVLLIVSLIMGVIPAGAQETSVKAKQFPTGYFSQYHKIPIPEKEKVLAKLDATLKQLTQDGNGLIAKGAVIEKPDPAIMTYPQLTILDESGLVIIARQVPNLFYQYRGKSGINPNIYIIIKNARVNIPESYIRYSYVVEGDFVAYVNKFVSAVMEGLERPAEPQGRQPAARPGKPQSGSGRLERKDVQ